MLADVIRMMAGSGVAVGCPVGTGVSCPGGAGVDCPGFGDAVAIGVVVSCETMPVAPVAPGTSTCDPDGRLEFCPLWPAKRESSGTEITINATRMIDAAKRPRATVCLPIVLHRPPLRGAGVPSGGVSGT